MAPKLQLDGTEHFLLHYDQTAKNQKKPKLHSRTNYQASNSGHNVYEASAFILQGFRPGFSFDIISDKSKLSWYPVFKVC